MNPPITLNTIFQSILTKRMKIAAPFRKLNLTKKRIITGKNARTGMDWTISKNGRSRRSVVSFTVTRNARGMATASARAYAARRRRNVAKIADQRYESDAAGIALSGKIGKKRKTTNEMRTTKSGSATIE